MFYKLGDVLEEISFEAISDDELVVGLITCEELAEYGPALGFDAYLYFQSFQEDIKIA